MNTVVLESVLTCQRCSFAKQETMSTNACSGSISATTATLY